MNTYFLKTKRIGFSTWQKDDSHLAETLWGDEAVTAFLSSNGKFTEEEIAGRLQTEIENYKHFHVQYFPIFELSTNAFIGCCGLRPFDIEKNIYELGFHLLKPYWGQGYAMEVGHAIIAYAFDELNAYNIIAGHHPNNIASQRVLKKLDFNYTGTQFYPPTGLEHSSYVYHIFQE